MALWVAEHRAEPEASSRRVPVPPVVGAFGVPHIVDVVVRHQQVFAGYLVLVVLRHVGADPEAETETERENNFLSVLYTELLKPSLNCLTVQSEDDDDTHTLSWMNLLILLLVYLSSLYFTEPSSNLFLRSGGRNRTTPLRSRTGSVTAVADGSRSAAI